MRQSSRILTALCLLLLASNVLAKHPNPEFTISPSSGPSAGDTEVTISGVFGNGPYAVNFGGVPARSTTRLNEHTLVAVTPAHLPGLSDIRIFEFDIFLDTGLTFEFTGEVPTAAFERILVPLHIHTIFGAFGSEFRTDLQLTGKHGQVNVFGLDTPCIVTCIRPSPTDWPVEVTASEPNTFDPNGTPGRFFFVRKEQTTRLAGNLRASDVSRSAQNFGTEIPLVREREFEPVEMWLPGVPTDARFRNTLRVYSPVESAVRVQVDGQPDTYLQLTKPEGGDIFTPAYGVFSNFPIGAGQVKVTVTVDSVTGPSPPIYLGGPIWAFVSVTNNDTQTITTITPQP